MLTIDPANLKNDQVQSEWPWLGKRTALALALITFCVGVAATSAWQSYGGAAREIIASSFPRLGWAVPQATPVSRNTPHTGAPAAPAAPPSHPQQLYANSLDLHPGPQNCQRHA